MVAVVLYDEKIIDEYIHFVFVYVDTRFDIVAISLKNVDYLILCLYLIIELRLGDFVGVCQIFEVKGLNDVIELFLVDFFYNFMFELICPIIGNASFGDDVSQKIFTSRAKLVQIIEQVVLQFGSFRLEQLWISVHQLLSQHQIVVFCFGKVQTLEVIPQLTTKQLNIIVKVVIFIFANLIKARDWLIVQRVETIQQVLQFAYFHLFYCQLVDYLCKCFCDLSQCQPGIQLANIDRSKSFFKIIPLSIQNTSLNLYPKLFMMLPHKKMLLLQSPPQFSYISKVFVEIISLIFEKSISD